MATTAPKKSTQAAQHHLQFALLGPNFEALIEPRQYKLTWTNQGEKTPQVTAGATDEQGLTQRISTLGKVPVTLQIAPPDSSDCKLVGSATAKPLTSKPLVRVQLAFAAQVTSAPKPMNACERITVREGLQRIQFEIHNITRYTSETSGASYPNYLNELPYLIVNADTLEIISDQLEPPTVAPRMTGSASKISTAIVNVDGIKTVGLVLGSATDDQSIWKADKGEKAVFFRVQPKESGLTSVVIQEVPRTSSLATDGVKQTVNYKGELNGAVWASICRSFTVDDVKRILPGSLEVVAKHPNEMQIAYAQSRGILNETQAQTYREALAARQDSKGSAKKPATPPDLPPLTYACSWAELLAPIYEGHIEHGDPPNPQVPVMETDPKTKARRPKLDPVTKEPVTKLKFNGDKYEALKLQGDGQILIKPLGLTLELSGSIVNFGEPMAQNAQEVTGLAKDKVMAKTHPYAYLALLESCMNCGVTYVMINCTWRPMIGSVLHKLGDAIDIGKIDNDSDSLKMFTFLNAQVDDLADRFTKALNTHRYAKPGLTIYNFDNLPANAPFHHNHLHFTADRLKPLQDQDKPRATQATQ
jgi:hypothetical protein